MKENKIFNFLDKVKYFGLRKLYYIFKNQYFLIRQNIIYFQQNIFPGTYGKKMSLSKIRRNKFDKSYFIGTGSNYEVFEYPLDFLEKMYLHKRIVKLSKYIKRKSKTKILDIGCANGLFVNYAHKQGFDTYGIDVSRDAIHDSKEFKNLNTYVCNAESLRYPFNYAIFDIITAFDLIEHLVRPKILLSNINKYLKIGGIAYIITPNGKQKADHDITHISLKKKSDWEKMIRDSGFEILESYNYKWYPPSPYLFIQILLRFVNILKGNYIEQTVVIFKKNE